LTRPRQRSSRRTKHSDAGPSPPAAAAAAAAAAADGEHVVLLSDVGGADSSSAHDRDEEDVGRGAGDAGAAAWRATQPAAAATAAGAAAAPQTWWRLWLSDASYQSLLGLLVHAGVCVCRAFTGAQTLRALPVLHARSPACVCASLHTSATPLATPSFAPRRSV
jgi:hypothetical protein